MLSKMCIVLLDSTVYVCSLTTLCFICASLMSLMPSHGVGAYLMSMIFEPKRRLGPNICCWNGFLIIVFSSSQSVMRIYSIRLRLFLASVQPSAEGNISFDERLLNFSLPLGCFDFGLILRQPCMIETRRSGRGLMNFSILKVGPIGLLRTSYLTSLG